MVKKIWVYIELKGRLSLAILIHIAGYFNINVSHLLVFSHY